MVPEPKTKSFFGAGAGSFKLPPDIDEPVGLQRRDLDAFGECI
jgi:hypothetical protein